MQNKGWDLKEGDKRNEVRPLFAALGFASHNSPPEEVL